MVESPVDADPDAAGRPDVPAETAELSVSPAAAPLKNSPNSFIYLVPFSFSCAFLTLAPLITEILIRLFPNHFNGSPMVLVAMRPLALLTGAGYGFVLLMRGFLSDFQVITLVALVISIVTAMMESMTAGSGALSSGYGIASTLNAMSTILQGTFFAAAAVAGWMSPPAPRPPPADFSLRHGGVIPRAAQNRYFAEPPRFVLHVLSLLAIAHFLLPFDMMVQSTLRPSASPGEHLALHETARIGLWCLAAIWLLAGAFMSLSRREAE